jgi:putative transposase
MPSKKISEENNTAPHFLTLTVKNWYYLFDRHNRWDILLDSLCYCQKTKRAQDIPLGIYAEPCSSYCTK